jgi:hypothetical protein
VADRLEVTPLKTVVEDTDVAILFTLQLADDAHDYDEDG